jgi:hypothetical protein
MSHFAQVKDSIVQQVIVAEQDFINTLEDAPDWIQTSYNTRGGVHYSPDSNEPDNGTPLRYNYAGIGYTYNSEKDAFIAPQPYASWVLNNDTCLWNAPIEYPSDGKVYYWDESLLNWVEFVIPE